MAPAIDAGAYSRSRHEASGPQVDRDPTPGRSRGGSFDLRPELIPPSGGKRGPIASFALDSLIKVAGFRYILDAVRTGATIPDVVRDASTMGSKVSAALVRGAQTIAAAPTHVATEGAALGAYRLSYGLGLLLSPMQALTAGTSLADAIGQEGPAGVVNTTVGRTGLLNLACTAGGVIVSLRARHLIRTEAAAAGITLGKREVISRVLAHPLQANKLLVGFGIGTMTLAFLNELGYFDAFNKGEKRPLGTIFADANGRLGSVLHENTVGRFESREGRAGLAGTVGALVGSGLVLRNVVGAYETARKAGAPIGIGSAVVQGVKQLARSPHALLGTVAATAAVLGANHLGLFDGLDR